MPSFSRRQSFDLDPKADLLPSTRETLEIFPAAFHSDPEFLSGEFDLILIVLAESPNSSSFSPSCRTVHRYDSDLRLPKL